MLLLCIIGLAGCFEWTQDSQGNLQSVGLPGVPVWESKRAATAGHSEHLGLHPGGGRANEWPGAGDPLGVGPYHYRFYQTGQNHCAEDVQKIMAARAAYPYATIPRPTAPISRRCHLLRRMAVFWGSEIRGTIERH